jgi:hypothetical protein
MATYVQIYDFVSGNTQGIKTRIIVAVGKAQATVRSEAIVTPNHTNRVTWAKQTAEAAAADMLWAVVFSAPLQADGPNVTDANLQTVVDGLIDKFALG